MQYLILQKHRSDEHACISDIQQALSLLYVAFHPIIQKHGCMIEHK